MTLRTKHGGPVFDGLWNMQHTDGDNYFQLIVNGGERHNGDKRLSLVFRIEKENWEPDLADWVLTECYTPINLVKWSD